MIEQAGKDLFAFEQSCNKKFHLSTDLADIFPMLPFTLDDSGSHPLPIRPYIPKLADRWRFYVNYYELRFFPNLSIKNNIGESLKIIRTGFDKALLSEVERLPTNG